MGSESAKMAGITGAEGAGWESWIIVLPKSQER
jgi:hypothetical protein